MIDGIKNLWKWKNIIWKDRWYDHDFLYKVMLFKLDDMINNWDKAHYVGSNFTKGRMIILRKRLDTISEKLDDLLYETIVDKKYTRKQYLKERKKLLENTWLVFGKNIERFWD